MPERIHHGLERKLIKTLNALSRIRGVGQNTARFREHKRGLMDLLHEIDPLNHQLTDNVVHHPEMTALIKASLKGKLKNPDVDASAAVNFVASEFRTNHYAVQEIHRSLRVDDAAGLLRDFRRSGEFLGYADIKPKTANKVVDLLLSTHKIPRQIAFNDVQDALRMLRKPRASKGPRSVKVTLKTRGGKNLPTDERAYWSLGD
ncbi:MAG: hypothetical protein JW834_03515 [Candidatus Diapherotrites archaeon]|nr:hypothetical protein [Candidatus Diapherotrites archaeon]